jgi:hypothetical protein
MDWRLKLFLFVAAGFILALLPPAAWIELAAFVGAALFVAALWALAMVARGFMRSLRAHYGDR